MAGCASSGTFCQYLEGLTNGRRAARAPVQEPAAWEFTVAQCVLTIKTGNAVTGRAYCLLRRTEQQQALL